MANGLKVLGREDYLGAAWSLGVVDAKSDCELYGRKIAARNAALIKLENPKDIEAFKEGMFWMMIQYDPHLDAPAVAEYNRGYSKYIDEAVDVENNEWYNSP